MKEISIIVPVYNVALYLEKCLDSLIHQTFKNYEIILIDDGSNDNSGPICENYAQLPSNQIRVIHQSNAGLSAARNTGIEAANGRYITFVDSDDWVEPNFLEVLYNNIINTNSDLSCCGLMYDSTEGSTPICTYSENIAYTQEQLFGCILTDSQFYGYVCNKMYNRSLIGALRFDTNLRSAEDMDFMVKYASGCNNAVFNRTQLYHYRQRLGSMTGDFTYNPIKLSVLAVNKELIDFYTEYAPEYRDLVLANFVKTNLNIIGRMGISNHYDSTLLSKLKSNVVHYWNDVIKSRNLPISLKANMILTRIFPIMMLRAKQFLIKRNYK